MKKLALTSSAMVLFLCCATVPQTEFEFKVSNGIHNLFVGYTDIADGTKLANI